MLLALVACTKEGDTIYQPNPNEKKPPTTPLVTVIYGPNGLGDRSYNDLIYKGVEMAAKLYGVRILQLVRAFAKDYSVSDATITWGGNAGDDSTQGTGISDEGATGDNR